MDNGHRWVRLRGVIQRFYVTTYKLSEGSNSMHMKYSESIEEETDRREEKKRQRSLLLFGGTELNTALAKQQGWFEDKFLEEHPFWRVVVRWGVNQMIIHCYKAYIMPSVRSSIHPFLQIILVINLYSATRNWMNSVPQTAVTTFAFSSVWLFFYKYRDFPDLFPEPIEDALVEYGEAGGCPHLPGQQVEGLSGALHPAHHHRLVGLTPQLVVVRRPAHRVHSLTGVVTIVRVLERLQRQPVHNCRLFLVGTFLSAALGWRCLSLRLRLSLQQLTILEAGDLKTETFVGSCYLKLWR